MIINNGQCSSTQQVWFPGRKQHLSEFTESQNPRLLWVERDLKTHPLPASALGRDPFHSPGQLKLHQQPQFCCIWTNSASSSSSPNSSLQYFQCLIPARPRLGGACGGHQLSPGCWARLTSTALEYSQGWRLHRISEQPSHPPRKVSLHPRGVCGFPLLV